MQSAMLCASSSLTRREREIVSRVAAGLANKVIAYELGVSESTVATHLGRAMRKLGISRREGLLPLPCSRSDLAGLTRAEREVVTGVLRGLSDRGIAGARGTSPRTVANQLQSVYRKLGVASRSELRLFVAPRSTREEDRAGAA